MAIVYVDDSASGANDGTSKTDAYTSILSADGAGSAAGDSVWVSHTHNEDLGGAVTINFSNGSSTNPVKIFSVNFSDDTLTPGATIFNTSANNTVINGHIFVYGITVNMGAALMIASTTDRQVWDTCTIGINTGASGNRILSLSNSLNGGAFLRFHDSTINLDTNGGSSSLVSIVSQGIFEFVNCTISVNSAAQSIFDLFARTARVLVQNCDLSSSPETTLLDWSSVQNAEIIFRRCNLPASYTPSTGAIGLGCRMIIENSSAGTISAPVLAPQRVEHEFGVIAASLTRYRTGGANDGEQANAYSWEMASNANCREIYSPIESPPMIRWVGTGSQTLTVYLASGVTLQDDEFWIEVSSPGEGGSPTARGVLNSTRAEPMDTPANLTTDGTSTWNGTGVGTLQKIDVAITPAVAGPVVVRAFLAKASTTVYLDPKIEVA